MTSRRSTSADVARRAQVSRATVSYVLNDVAHQSIPEATRQRVLDAARELDYTPHAAARALRAGQSRLVLLVNSGVPYGTNLSVMIDALAAEVTASGRSLVIWQQSDPADLAATIEHLQPVVVLALGRLDPEQTALLQRTRIPYVRAEEDSPIDVGAALQVRHLAERGHRRIGMLTTSDPRLAVFAEPRLATARATCAELGLAPPLVYAVAEVSVTDLGAVLQQWTGSSAPVTAVACYNDILAAACLAAAHQIGIAVPERLAVVGIDDEPMSAYTRPTLTTIRLEMVAYARRLWGDGAAALAGEPRPDGPDEHVSLVVRQSS